MTDTMLAWLRSTIEADKAADEKLIARSQRLGHLVLHGSNSPHDTIARCEAELALLDHFAETKAWYDQYQALPAGEVHGLWTAIKSLAAARRHREGFNPDWLEA